MSCAESQQFKVWAFLKRNATLLSHDEYRAGHVGYHCSNTRRLKDIRGYAVNIHDQDDEGLHERLSSSGAITQRAQPEGFLEMWDGFPAVLFDTRAAWLAAATPEASRAAPEGLIVDPDWSLADGPYLFDRISENSTQFRSYHTRMEEYVVKPVVRFESRPCKLMLFFRPQTSLDHVDFRHRFFAKYVELLAAMPELNGLVANFRDRDIDAAPRDYYPSDHWCFSEEGRNFRQQFYSLWTGALECYVHELDEFVTARQRHPQLEQLMALEDELFEALWYVQVDENIIVMPNRGLAPPFYHR